MRCWWASGEEREVQILMRWREKMTNLGEERFGRGREWA